MKNAMLLLVAASLLIACGRTEKVQENPIESIATADSVAPPVPKLQNCQSVVDADKIGKSNDYQESAKPIKVTLTLNQDTTAKQTDKGCYFNNTITVLATKKTGKQLFKRTLLKDDLLYFTKTDAIIEQAILQRVTYKPTFNSQKYITLTMHLIDPNSRRATDYILFMNYFGEIVKVK